MGLSMFDVVFRPLRTSRKLFRMMKDIELHPTLRGTQRETPDSNYVILTSNVLMPTAVYNMIKESLVVMDIKFGAGKSSWERHKTQDVRTHKMSFEEAITMLVTERLEDN